MEILKNIDFNNYKYLFISTTAQDSLPILRLPDRKIFNGESLNFLITEESTAIEFFKNVDGLISTIIIDIESKQAIDLYSLAELHVVKSNIYTNKPNDLAVESADVLLQHHFSRNITGKKILVIGTGNISFKIALRLAERNAQVFIDGRNEEKIKKIIETINIVIPSYSKHKVRKMNKDKVDEKLDAIVSFISAEKVIDENYNEWLRETSISIDGGIGNFSEAYIAGALKKESKVIRLDVRIALPFMEASLATLTPSFSFFQKVSGERKIGEINIVAGGIIGQEGSIIVDQIEKPQQIIGIANGYGGVKNESTISEEESRNIEILRAQLL